MAVNSIKAGHYKQGRCFVKCYLKKKMLNNVAFMLVWRDSKCTAERLQDEKQQNVARC
jgi:hypothetical protein